MQNELLDANKVERREYGPHNEFVSCHRYREGHIDRY